MSILTMNMESYQVQRSDSDDLEYSDEVLCSGWVPTLALQQSLALHSASDSAMPDGLKNVDVELFLRKMYRAQR